MKKLYGIWVDHAGAYVVTADEKDILSVRHLESGVESHHKSGESGEHSVLSDQLSEDKRRQGHMNKFAKELLGLTKDGDEIAIIGPSTAKFELRKEYEKDINLAQKIIAFEACDKMTENQLKAYFKEIFALPREE